MMNRKTDKHHSTVLSVYNAFSDAARYAYSLRYVFFAYFFTGVPVRLSCS